LIYKNQTVFKYILLSLFNCGNATFEKGFGLVKYRMLSESDPNEKHTKTEQYFLEPAESDEDDAHPLPADRDMARTITDLRRENLALREKLIEAQQTGQKLLALNDFGKDLENAPGPERTAQAVGRTLARLVGCGLVCVFETRPPDGSLKLLAAAGPCGTQVPASFSPDLNEHMISLAVHNHRMVTSRDLPEATPPLLLAGQRFPSLLAAPLARGGRLLGLILLADAGENAFNPGDFPVVESAAAQLLNAWQYAYKNNTLTGFVQAISMMSVVQQAPALLEMTASIARETLDASYVIAAGLNQQEWVMREAGKAPRLFHSLNNGGLSFLESAAQAQYTFRLRDLRQDERAAILQIDSPDLCSMLASPIRINSGSSGILLAFGKKGAEGFTDTDVFLTELLTAQTAINLESCFLNHELRASLKTTQLLYDLSLSISQAETLSDASRAIARTAYRLLQARKCGLVLFSADGRTEAEVQFPTDDLTLLHPYNLIQQAMDSRQTIYMADNGGQAQVAIPIQTRRRCYGALWLETAEEHEEGRHPTEEIRILVNQAAVALERSILLEETRFQASEITNSYRRLEGSYEDLLYGLTRALDARDGETEKHSVRVEDLAVRLGLELGLNRPELQALKRGALLHDIGKIGIPDGILRKPGRLDEAEWVEMRQHPQKGAQIVQEIPALHDALPVIAFHQERWDGSGYPLHLSGNEIPLIARIFAVVDVFDALISDRPYRKAMPPDEAIAYLESQAGRHFDPEVVRRFIQMIHQRSSLPAI
jgi:putative nucleotidyltransferase with HDIG domain